MDFGVVQAQQQRMSTCPLSARVPHRMWFPGVVLEGSRGSDASRVRLWDARTRQQVRPTLVGHNRRGNRSSFQPRRHSARNQRRTR